MVKQRWQEWLGEVWVKNIRHSNFGFLGSKLYIGIKSNLRFAQFLDGFFGDMTLVSDCDEIGVQIKL